MATKSDVIDHFNNMSRIDLGGYMRGYVPPNQKFEGKVVAKYGGEDQGSTYYAVWKFDCDDGELFLKFHGWYSSYDGATYEDFHVVTPKLVYKTEYV